MIAPASGNGIVTPPPMHLGLRLRNARVAQGFSQRDVCDRTGLSPSTISMIEGGGSVGVKAAQAIRALLAELETPDGGPSFPPSPPAGDPTAPHAPSDHPPQTGGPRGVESVESATPAAPAPKRRRSFPRPAPTPPVAPTPAPLSPLDAMIAKLPDFDPTWPATVQESWLGVYSAILMRLLEQPTA